MRTVAAVGLACGLALAAGGQPPKVEFKPAASAAGKYKVLFPGPVKTETAEVKAAAGTRKVTVDSAALDDGTLFLVSYVDVPEDVAKAPPGPRLDKIRDANKGLSGKVLSEKPVEFGPDKLPARDLLIQKDPVVVRTRVILAEARLYQVAVQGTQEFVTSKAADEFFDSFDITK